MMSLAPDPLSSATCYLWSGFTLDNRFIRSANPDPGEKGKQDSRCSARGRHPSYLRVPCRTCDSVGKLDPNLVDHHPISRIRVACCYELGATAELPPSQDNPRKIAFGVVSVLLPHAGGP